jgi:hypothetical protein
MTEVACRKVPACLALPLLAPVLALALVLPATVAAAPVVTLSVTPRSIPGFPGTGNILGAGVAVETKATISGSEYDGSPSPLTELVIYAPAGVRVDPDGFATCAPSALAAEGVAACPAKSRAGPLGEGLGVVTFGGQRVEEKASIQPFFAPDGGLSFYLVGSQPVAFEVLENAHWSAAAAPFGPKLVVEVPLIASVPGADDASILSFTVRVGAAYRRGRHTTSYFTLPKRCPKGGFPVKAELRFLSGEISTVALKEPCPMPR